MLKPEVFKNKYSDEVCITKIHYSTLQRVARPEVLSVSLRTRQLFCSTSVSLEYQCQNRGFSIWTNGVTGEIQLYFSIFCSKALLASLRNSYRNILYFPTSSYYL